MRLRATLRAVAAFALGLGCEPADLSAQQAGATSRLTALAELWGYVKYHHPEFADRPDIDWDTALVVAIPRVREARSRGEFRSALNGMLAMLHDPLTRVVPDSEPAAERGTQAPTKLAFQFTADSILVVTIGDYYALPEAESQAKLRQIVAASAKARAIVLDVRARQPVDAFGRLQLTSTVAQLERVITTQSLTPPGERYRAFYGYENPSPFSSGQYRTGFFTRFGVQLRPAPDARDVPLVVLLDHFAAIPGAALPLEKAGRALIVFEGDPESASIGRTHPVDVGERSVVDVRESEPVFADGTSAQLRPDLTVAAGALDSALALARRFHPSSIARAPLPATANAPAERSYASMTAPTVEYRLLALFRFWNVIRYFYPYHRLPGTAWDSVLTVFIPRFEQAADSLAYARTVAELAVRLRDSHAYVAGAVYVNQLIGAGYPPIRVRIVQGQPVVVAIYDSTAARAGVSIGDVVLRVDGEPATARLARYVSLISASTMPSAMDKAALSFMNGPVGSTVRLQVRGAGSAQREATLTRRAEDFTTLYHRERSGEIVRILPGNIGYVDLDRLPLELVDSMFDRLRHTKAIIFDMRGYPNGTIWAIAPRLSSKRSRVALIETPLVGQDTPRDAEGAAFEAFYQTIDPTPRGAWLYTGRTVMLMDQWSESQAEHTGLYLRAASGTKFIGSATAGADGEIVTVILPGAITVGFTGQSVRWPDGRELQRIGLQPDVRITPTIEGVRHGRDEVLEGAVKYLNTKEKTRHTARAQTS